MIGYSMYRSGTDGEMKSSDFRFLPPQNYKQNTIQHGNGSGALTFKPFTRQRVMRRGGCRKKDQSL